MSRLRELMEELCPGGVEYKKLGEIAEIIRGNGLQKKDFVDQGIGCIHYGQIYTRYGAFADRTLTYVTPQLAATLKTVSNGDLVVAITSENVEDVCKCVAWLGEDDIVTGGHAAIVKHKQNPKYLAYLFQTEDFFRQKRKYVVGTKVIEMSPKKLAEIIIPVPPLEIQNEIVKLLDNFTELTAELTAELTLRKKQYNFYRDSLLNFVRVDDTIVQTDRQTDRQVQRISKFGLWRKEFEVEWKMLGEVCGLKAGTAISASCIREQKNDVYKTPCYGGNGLRGYVQEVNHYSDAPLIGRQGALCGNVCFAKAPYYATEHAVIVDGKKNFNNRFLFHVLVNMNLGQYKTAGAQPGLSVKRLNKVKIAIPKLEIQNSIANILDRFDTLCNDLTSGLPAEIAARKKQYEHYRDRLLTFPRSKLEERS